MEAISLDFKSDEFVNLFCEKYAHISHRELKKIDEFTQIQDQSLKDKIYFKIRYNHLKSNDKLLDNVTYIHSNFKNIKYQNKSNKFPLEAFLKILICFSIFTFLAYESVYFYKEMGISNFYSYLLPVVLEGSVFFLFLKKDYISKVLLFFIVFFNIFTISFNTADKDIKNIEARKKLEQQHFELKKIKDKNEAKLINLEKDLITYRGIYADLVRNGFFKKAEDTVRPEIIRIETSIKETNNSLPSLNNSKFVSISTQNSVVDSLSPRSFNLIGLKIILLFVFLLFINDLKESSQRNTEC